MTLVKICGIRALEHARAALDAGADFLGFIFFRPSHRYVEPAEVDEIVAACRASHGGANAWKAVGVFVDEPLDLVNEVVGRARLDVAQLCGSETPEFCRAVRAPVLRAVHVAGDGTASVELQPRPLGAWRLLLDAKVEGMYGGTGCTVPWSALRRPAAEGFLAGGLNAGNVGAAIAQARPWAVDVSGGVERQRTKDPELIREFVEEVRRVDRYSR